MKRAFSYLFILFVLTETAFAQADAPKERYTYLWDVTRSMRGYGENNPDIYDIVKEKIISDFNNIPDNDETEIYVVAFRGRLNNKGYQVWKAKADSKDRKYLEEMMNEFETDVNKSIGNTNTYTALKYVVDNILTEDRVDYLKIMTDGGCDEPEAFERMLNDWCSIKEEKNVYAYYITLTKKARDYRDTIITHVHELCNFIFVEDLDGIDQVRQLTLSSPHITEYNLLTDKGATLKYKFDVSLGDETIEPGFKIHCKTKPTAGNLFFIDEIVTLDNYNAITVTPQTCDFAYHNLSNDECRNVELVFTPAKGNEKKFAYVNFSDSTHVISLSTTKQNICLETESVECNVKESNSKIKIRFNCGDGTIKPGYKVNYRCEYFNGNDTDLFAAKGSGTLDENLELTITPEVNPEAKHPNRLGPNKRHEYANIILTPDENNSENYKNVAFEQCSCKVVLVNKTIRTIKIRYEK